MIEELCEYLVRQGWSQDIADDAHDAYGEDGLDGVADSMTWAGDYCDELVEDIKEWQHKVGEA